MHSYSQVLREYSLHDPLLTPLGETQCAELQQHLRANEPLADQIELIVASPMRRTLQTAQLGLTWLIDRGVPVKGLAEVQGWPNPSVLVLLPRLIVEGQNIPKTLAT